MEYRLVFVHIEHGSMGGSSYPYIPRIGERMSIYVDKSFWNYDQLPPGKLKDFDVVGVHYKETYIEVTMK